MYADTILPVYYDTMADTIETVNEVQVICTVGAPARKFGLAAGYLYDMRH